MTSDLRYVLRSLVANPGFAAIAILSLAIGIGANSAIFSVVRYLLLDQLPLPRPSELALVYWSDPHGQLKISQTSSSGYRDPESGLNYRSNYNHRIYRALKETVGPGVSLAGFNFVREVSVAIDGLPATIGGGLLADAAYFSTLRLAVTLGRSFTDADDRPGAPPVVVLGHAFWQRAFGGDSGIVGRRVRINGHAFEVIGITAAGFGGLSRGGFFPPTDITVPLSTQPLIVPRWGGSGRPLTENDEQYWVRLVARVRPGMSRDAIAESLTATLRPLLPADAVNNPRPSAIRLLPGERGLAPSNPETPRLMALLSAVVGVVLLIACVNLASLMLARGAARQRELTVCRAIGASRWRTARPFFLESLVLALAGAAAGLLFTFWSRDLLNALLAAGLGASGFATMPVGVSIDWQLVLQTMTLACATALLFGLLPALQLTRRAAVGALGQRVAGAPTSRMALGRALIAVQIAASVPLIVGAALFLRTVANLQSLDLGFESRGVAFFRLDPTYAGVPEADYPGIYLSVLAAITAVPGVDTATLVENPLLAGLTSSTSATVDGRNVSVLMNAVGPGFFDVVGMKLLAGRAPGKQDDANAPRVAVVNEAAVRQWFGGASPIGRRFGGRDIEIVGIVSNSRYSHMRQDMPPIMFDAALQRPGFGGHHVLLRTRSDPATLEAQIRQAVARVSPDLPLPELRTQRRQLEVASATERIFMQLLTLFAGVALLLASIGLHGVTMHSVTRRTSEIGVRVALGARPTQVLWLILRQVLVVVAAGLAVGVPLALAAGPAVRAQLYGVSPNDAWLVTTAAGVMLTIALAAGVLPASRAARLDPVRALRTD